MARVRRWVVAAGVALLVTGCSADPKPRLSEPSETPAVTSTPSPTASAEPEPWEVRSEAGAVAFVKHWLTAFNQAAKSGETESLRSLSAEGCGTCANFAALIEELYGSGGRLESDGWRVSEVAVAEGLPASRASVSVRIEQSAERIHRRDEPVEVHPAGRATYTAELTWRQGRWSMTDFLLQT